MKKVSREMGYVVTVRTILTRRGNRKEYDNMGFVGHIRHLDLKHGSDLISV